MYNFDEVIDRKNTNSVNYDDFRKSVLGKYSDIALPYKDEDIIRMWVADMEFATPDFILNAIRERLDRKILGYTSKDSDEYYNVFSDWCDKKYGWGFKRNEFFISNGVVPALKTLVGLIGSKGENVLILVPSYTPFKAAAEYNGLNPIYSYLKYENGGYSIDFEDIEKKAADSNTKIFILCNPHNPTGRVWTKHELERMGDICVKNGLWLISDEIHCDLLRKGLKHMPMGKVLPDYDKLITCMAPSKTFNTAGLILSNVIIRNEALRKLWESRTSDIENPLSLAAAIAAFKYGEEWLKELKGYLDESFKWADEYTKANAPKAGFYVPESTYLGWLDVSKYMPEGKELNISLLFAKYGGVIVEGGNMFVANGKNHVRINFACTHLMLKEGIRRICGVLNDIETGAINLEADDALLY